MNARRLSPIRLLVLALLPAAAPPAGAWFEPAATVAEYRPKGPTHCFRQFNIDWSWIARGPEQIREFLSEADPAAFAEFCARMNIDGTVVMAVPHHGYCTHETRVGVKFPGMKGDWFGRTIDELHKRRIAAFGYVTLNWNWKYMRENEGRDFIHGKMSPYGVREMICLNAPGYLELVEAYTREVMENYPVDGMRWDILVSAKGRGIHASSDCTCAGCRRLFREMYGRELTRWEDFDSRRHMDFYMATTRRAVERLHALCKGIKPSVEIWQNCLNSYHENDLNVGRLLDVAYNEFGDPFRLLLVRGATGKAAAINGLMNKASPAPGTPVQPLDRGEWRTCLALGGRCYSYYGHKQTDPRTLLPGEAIACWHREQLAPFYEMVGKIEPWLRDAAPVSHVGIVFSEATRFRFPDCDRAPYVAAMEPIAKTSIERSAPVEFVNCLDLGNPARPIRRLDLLVLPLTSGLGEEEVARLREYVDQGGSLLVAGDALRHDGHGAEQREFSLAREMGVSFSIVADAPQGAEVTGRLPGGGSPPAAVVRRVVRVEPKEGETLLWLKAGEDSWPLLHVKRQGEGRIAYLASLDSVELTQAAVDSLAGVPPVKVEPGAFRVVLAEQPGRRWILHLISDGDCAVQLDRSRVGAKRIAERYPREGWDCRAEENGPGLRVVAGRGARDRLVVLE